MSDEEREIKIRHAVEESWVVHVDESKKAEEKKQEKADVNSKLHLKDIDLTINDGEFVCIVGDVGSGKTSLLNAVIGEMMYVSKD